MKTARFGSFLFFFLAVASLPGAAQGSALSEFAEKTPDMINTRKSAEKNKQELPANQNPPQNRSQTPPQNAPQNQIPSAESRREVLRLKFVQEKGGIGWEATTTAGTKKIRIEEGKGKLSHRMNRLNTMLENYGQHSEEKFRSELRELGEWVYGPVKEELLQAEEVAIGITPGMIRFPFEHLYFEGKPLGLQKPVVFYFDPFPTSKFSHENLRSAQMIADLTADPEEACKKAAKQFKNADYRSLDTGKTGFIRNLKPHDLLLVSAHGDISYGEDDCIEFDEESFYPESWAKVAPKLAYFDSCQVGASAAFVKAFKKAGTQYFLAPITSNEAGDSSTKTIRYFFESLMNGDSPERALHQTKIRLYQHYSGRDISYGYFLYRVMPFRVYRLN